MESVLNLIFSAENIRMLVLLAFGYSYLTRFRTSFEKRMDGLDRKIDGVEASLALSHGGLCPPPLTNPPNFSIFGSKQLTKG